MSALVMHVRGQDNLLSYAPHQQGGYDTGPQEPLVCY